MQVILIFLRHKRMDLHTPPTGGPLMAVDWKIILLFTEASWWFLYDLLKLLITDLHYIGNDIDEIAGGPHAVVVFTIFAHLVFTQ